MNPIRDANTIRAFISVSLEPELIAAIGTLQRSLDAALGKSPMKWTRPDQLHLTLRFLGNVAETEVPQLSEALRRACHGSRRFNLFFDQIGCFPSPRKPAVVWLGLQGDLAALRQLQSRIEEETKPFGSHSETREFHPHLTIGRAKAHSREAGRVGELIERTRVPKLGEWTVREVNLMKSTLSAAGSVYSTLAAIGIGGYYP
jgi:2'-5' RNA ligase